MSDSVSVGAGSSVNGDSSGRGSVSSYGTTSEWGDFENDVVVEHEQRTNELTRKQTVDGNTLSQPVCSSLLLQAPKGPTPCEAGSNDGSMSAALPPLIAAPPQPVAITLEVFREGMLSSDSPSAIDATSLRRRMRVHGTLASRAPPRRDRRDRPGTTLASARCSPCPSSRGSAAHVFAVPSRGIELHTAATAAAAAEKPLPCVLSACLGHLRVRVRARVSLRHCRCCR